MLKKHIYKERIKFEDLRFMEQFLNPHEYMFKFDIKQGYHHVDIHKPYQRLLGFSWEVGGGELVILYLLSSNLD